MSQGWAKQQKNLNFYRKINREVKYIRVIKSMQIEITGKGYFHSISEFRFIKDIGVGSFGKVKLAVHRGTRKQYAIKIIDLSANLSDTQLQIILREIKIHSRLEHPHIIKLWDTLMEQNKIYMVMDYAKNGSLFRYHSALLQNETQPSSSQIYQFFYQALQALKYLHSNDLMHRDIKPQNLLLDEDYNVRLCDFGWATNQITTPRSTFCGTYEYMAPQMVLEKSYDYRIDTWALGVLLYELVHGKAPFQAENLKAMKEKINKGSYQIQSNCQGSLKNLIVDILQFLPEKRLSIADIQSHPWVKQRIELNDESLISSTKTGISNMRKHQHQKSLGNFHIEAHKNYFNDIFADPVKQKYHFCGGQFDHTQNLYVGNSGKNQVKKHKRNITQPDNKDFIDKPDEVIQMNAISKKVQANFGLIRLETNTLVSPASQEPAYLLAGQKAKTKCKTLAEQQLSKIEPLQLHRKNTNETQDLTGTRKKKHNMVTQPDAITTGYTHTRNCSGQFKENEGDHKQKARKKTKLQQKICIKDRNQMPSKFAFEKARQIQRLAFS